MTAAADLPAPAVPAAGGGAWALADAGLLVAVLVTSSDMLNHLDPLPMLTWMACYGLALLRIAMTWPWLVGVVARNPVVPLFPAVCLASTLWSVAPPDTLRAGVQLAMTFLIATYLGGRYSATLILKCMVGVLSVAVALSLLHWATGVFPWPVHTAAGGLAGLFSHKNMLGQRALFAMVAIAAIWLMRRSEASGAVKAAATAAFAAMMLTLALSQSMTSVLLMPPAFGLVLLIGLRRVPTGVAAAAGAGVLLLAALGPVALAVGGIDPVGTVLGAVGKDATLTGRTLIWDVARGIAAERPVLGVGYAGAWSSPLYANERLMVLHAGAASPSFHNFVLEIRVAVGWPGLAAMLALLGVATARAWRLWREAGAAAGAGALGLVATIVTASLVGASLYRQHEFMIVVLVMLTVAAGEDLRHARHRPRAAEA